MIKSTRKILLPCFCFLLWFTLPATLLAQAAKTSFKFDFGSGKAADGYQKIGSDVQFDDNKGYGFDFDSKVTAVVRNPRKLLTGDYVTSDKPFYFSVNVPEGNYKVTLLLGDIKGNSNITVRAESRRLMLEKVKTSKGNIKRVSFIVNIRKPDIGTGGKVSLKPREFGKYDWDDKLSLEFNDTLPCIDALEIEKVDDQVTVYLAGNSTVVDQDDEPWCSWGQMITRFFKPGVAIADHAESGLTLGSFLNSHRLDKILSIIKPGDYLFIEFGHNDQKEKGPEDGAYKSYTDRLKLFISKIRDKNAIPVIVTSTSRRAFNDSSKVVNTLGDYPDAARKVAKAQNVPLIDLNVMTAKLYEALGNEGSKKAFVWYPANSFLNQPKDLADNTHFNSYGAYEIAKCVIEGIKGNHLGIEKYIIDAPPYDPSHPDPADTFNLPASPKNSTIKPDGN
ncbi:rhamnogalacturonan acetylesterase [Mucilaginibacter sp. KACC 22773]|uniref:rhamnogalacturonan acetylesterase n=1 Tax=Mucilaginibacter sp. KACC 22773 TaxID=3025671 RepID=UPI0023656D12|nr:rhamnogalacturonan acetylesterase [Mucilaginibacter sp. KACC 22773]WDF80430.1 rhamnogalacturonan acetylesterase [Mucilaginibacter sp. KACC 22773]